jgi:capsular polysaccharide biosynthesis protein
VEANEAMRRIFWRHRWLLIALVLIPVAVVATLRLTQPVKYAATATVQAQAAMPQVNTEATAILSRVTAVATSPSVVRTAIRQADVGGDALDVARHHVVVSSLSTSAITTVTVTAPDRLFAVRVARSLAVSVVATLNGLGTQHSQDLAGLSRQRAQLTADRDRLLRQLAHAQASRQPANSAGVQSLIAQLNAVETQLSTNATSVQQILANSTINGGAAIISVPTYATSVSRHVASDAALAGLLGLVVGVLIATIRELSRPTVADPAAAARELSLVLLGSARLKDGGTADIDDDLPTRLSLAARRLGARTLVLTGPVEATQLTALAADLDENLAAVIIDSSDDDPRAQADRREWGATVLSARVAAAANDFTRPIGPSGTISPHMPGQSPAGAGLSVVTLPAMTLQAQPKDPALVLVLPRFAPHAALDQAVDLGVTTGWPLLGVIGLRQRARRRH